MKRKELYFLIVLLAALAAGFAICFNYPYRARFFPLIVISLCALLALAELMKTAAATFRRPPLAGGGPPSEKPLRMCGGHRRRFVMATLWIGIFALMLWLLGFVIGLPLFMMAYIKLHGEKWRWALILPAVMFVIVYVGFAVLLKAPLHEGQLFLP